MKDFRDVIGLWPSRADLARDIGEPPSSNMVHQWWERNYIAADWYHLIVEAARRRVDAGERSDDFAKITYKLLFELGQEGRAKKKQSARARGAKPPHKAKRKPAKPKRNRAELEPCA